MNARQFFDKVALMRKLQKEYFRTRSKTALNQSKAVEREVDAEIARVHDALSTPATKHPNNEIYSRRTHHGRAGRGIHGFGAGHKFLDLMGISTPTMRMGLYRNPPSLQRLSEEVVLAANTLESDATQLPLRPTVDNVKYPHFRAK